jgi:hypothetical protein
MTDLQVSIKDIGISISISELIQFAVDEKSMGGEDAVSVYRNFSGTMTKDEWDKLMKMDVAIRFAERFADRFGELPRHWNSNDIIPPLEIHHKDGKKESLPMIVKVKSGETIVYAISRFSNGSWKAPGVVMEWGQILEV